MSWLPLRTQASQKPQERSPPSQPLSFDLDTPLVMFSPNDPWTMRDACEGVQVFGSIGAGKTSGSGRTIAEAFLRQGMGGLVLCAKEEERTLWEGYLAATNRQSSLIRFGPGQPWHFNFFDYQLHHADAGSGHAENIVRLFTNVTEIVEGKQHAGGGGEPFWERAGQELLRNAVDLIFLSGESFSLTTLMNLITSAPQTPGQLDDSTWKESSLCARLARQAQARLMEHQGQAASGRASHDFEMASRYWLHTYPNMAGRTRSSIVAHVTSVADTLLHGLAWELLCTDTTVTPEMTYRDGAVIVLDVSIERHEHLGRIIQNIWKLMFQRAILRRDTKAYSRPVFLWADEAQNFVSSFDYQYQSVARSARACTVYLTQNINNYYSVLGAQGRDEGLALLGNYSTKIWHANGDYVTNQFAADTIGQQWMWTENQGGSSSAQGPSVNVGESESVQYKVLPAAFSLLRKGGPLNGLEVDAIVYQNGRVWRTSQDTYLLATFKQT